MQQYRSYHRFIIVASLLLSLSTLVLAAPSKKLWSRWLPYNAQSTQTINHQAYQNFLNRYIVQSATGVNLVKYSKVSRKDKQRLNNYLNGLSKIKIKQYNRRVQLAYWINLYNALTIKTVLQHYPVKSIRNIKLGGWFSSGPWDAKLIKVDGVPLSLNDIEHRIIRPIWNDPRTHYALNCASYSCPNLQKKVYTGKNVNRMLNKAAREYINSPRGVSIKNNRLVVSSIYDWYQDDFGPNQQAVIAHLKKYAKRPLLKKLTRFNKINAYDYNWQLNGR